ncbi:MAG: hypothetical protein ABWY93_18970 [Mycobacterium sp.]
MDVKCRECEAERHHCHGTLIRHSLRYSECTDDDCDGPELIVHTLVIDCDSVGCDCAQPIGSAESFASSTG